MSRPSCSCVTICSVRLKPPPPNSVGMLLAPRPDSSTAGVDAGVGLGREPAVVSLRLVLDRLQHVVDERANAGAKLGELGREREVHHASGLGGLGVTSRVPNVDGGPMRGLTPPKTRAAARCSGATPASSGSASETSISGSAAGSRPSARAPFAAPTASRYGVGPESPRRHEDVPALGRAAGDRLDLADLLDRIDHGVRVRADADVDAALEDALRREIAVAEVGLGRWARADRGARRGHQVELAVGGVRGVDDRRPLGEQAGVGQELDRSAAVLGQALLDLAPLLAGVDVDDHPGALGVAGDLLEPPARARPHAVRRQADPPGMRGGEVVDAPQVGGDVGIAEPALARRGREARTGPLVGGHEQDDLDAGVGGGGDRRLGHRVRRGRTAPPSGRWCG